MIRLSSSPEVSRLHGWRAGVGVLSSVGGSSRGLLIAASKATVSVAALAVIASKIDLRSVIAHAEHLEPSTIVLCLAALAAEISLIASLRLKLVLAGLGTRQSLKRLLPVVMCGFFFEQVALGFVGGDAMRILLLRRCGLSVARAFAAIAIDRVLGLVGLLALALFGLPRLLRLVPALDGRLALVGIAAIAAVSITLFIALGLRVVGTFGQRLGQFRACLRSDSGLLARLLAVFDLACVTQLLNVLVFFLIGQDLQFGLSLWSWLLIVPPTLLLSMIPISAGGWGLREGGMIMALGTMGVRPEEAIIPSILFGLCLAVATLPGVLAWLVGRARPQAPGKELNAAQPIDLG